MKQKSYTFSEIKQKIANYCVYQDRSHQEVEQKLKELLEDFDIEYEEGACLVDTVRE